MKATPFKAGARNEALRAELLRRVTEAIVRIFGYMEGKKRGKKEGTSDGWEWQRL